MAEQVKGQHVYGILLLLQQHHIFLFGPNCSFGTFFLKQDLGLRGASFAARLSYEKKP